MQGKIRAIPVDDPKSGQQVIYENKIYKVKESWLGCDTCSAITELEGNLEVETDELFTLAVEYTPHKEKRHMPVKSQFFPLKFSQWSAALANGEVNSDKTVDFEVVTRTERVASPYEGHFISVDKTIAKIIPAKKEILEKLTSYYEDDFLEKFNVFIKNSKEFFDPKMYGNLPQAILRDVKRFVHQHYKK